MEERIRNKEPGSERWYAWTCVHACRHVWCRCWCEDDHVAQVLLCWHMSIDLCHMTERRKKQEEEKLQKEEEERMRKQQEEEERKQREEEERVQKQQEEERIRKQKEE